MDSYIDGYDWAEPGKTVVYKFFNNMGSDFFKRIVFNMKMKSFTTDEGWIIQSDRVQNYFSLESTDVSLAKRDDPELLHIVFSIFRYKDFYRRKYIKIQEVLAYIGGFISLFYNILSTFYNYIIFPDVLSLFWDKIQDHSKNNGLIDDRSHLNLIQFKPDISVSKCAPIDKDKVNASDFSVSAIKGSHSQLSRIPDHKTLGLDSKLKFGCFKKLFRRYLTNDKSSLYVYVQDLWNTAVSIETLGKFSISMKKFDELHDNDRSNNHQPDLRQDDYLKIQK